MMMSDLAFIWWKACETIAESLAEKRVCVLCVHVTLNHVLKLASPGCPRGQSRHHNIARGRPPAHHAALRTYRAVCAPVCTQHPRPGLTSERHASPCVTSTYTDNGTPQATCLSLRTTCRRYRTKQSATAAPSETASTRSYRHDSHAKHTSHRVTCLPGIWQAAGGCAGHCAGLPRHGPPQLQARQGIHVATDCCQSHRLLG